MLLTLKGKLKKGKVLAIRPNLSVNVINWVAVKQYVGKRGFFNCEIRYNKKELIGIVIEKCFFLDDAQQIAINEVNEECV